MCFNKFIRSSSCPATRRGRRKWKWQSDLSLCESFCVRTSAMPGDIKLTRTRPLSFSSLSRTHQINYYLNDGCGHRILRIVAYCRTLSKVMPVQIAPKYYFIVGHSPWWLVRLLQQQFMAIGEAFLLKYGGNGRMANGRLSIGLV